MLMLSNCFVMGREQEHGDSFLPFSAQHPWHADRTLVRMLELHTSRRICSASHGQGDRGISLRVVDLQGCSRESWRRVYSEYAVFTCGVESWLKDDAWVEVAGAWYLWGAEKGTRFVVSTRSDVENGKVRAATRPGLMQCA